MKPDERRQYLDERRNALRKACMCKRARRGRESIPPKRRKANEPPKGESTTRIPRHARRGEAAEAPQLIRGVPATMRASGRTTQEPATGAKGRTTYRARYRACPEGRGGQRTRRPTRKGERPDRGTESQPPSPHAQTCAGWRSILEMDTMYT